MAIWFWYFVLYSFLGFLLEKSFAWATGNPGRRKCFLLLPLCPVYGLAMSAVLALPAGLRGWPWILLTGGAAATATEYVFHWFCEDCFQVSFWDYSGIRGSIGGRIALPFSIAWGILTAAAVLWLQPALHRLAAGIPPGITYGCLLLLTADAVCTAAILRRTRTPDALSLRRLRDVG